MCDHIGRYVNTLFVCHVKERSHNEENLKSVLWHMANCKIHIKQFVNAFVRKNPHGEQKQIIKKANELWKTIKDDEKKVKEFIRSAPPKKKARQSKITFGKVSSEESTTSTSSLQPSIQERQDNIRQDQISFTISRGFC